MRLVVLAEEHLAVESPNARANVVGHPELLAQPDGHSRKIRTQAAWRTGRVGLDETIELEDGLFVEADKIEIAGRDSGFPEAIFDRPLREARIVLPAGKSFLLRGSDDAAVFDDARRRIVVVGGDAEDARHSGTVSEQRVDERRNHARLRED